MSDATQQEGYDVVHTSLIKVGGQDARTTLQRIFLALRGCMQQVGPEGLVTVTINAYVPQRRLPPAR